jgi:hypothetical protein
MRAGLGGLLVLALATNANAGFAFRKPITINGAQVLGGPHLDFPVLVSVVDPNLRTTANGGGVTSSSGYDIAFRAADGTTVLDWELERYDGTTGLLVAWVRMPGTAGPPDTRVQAGFSTVFYVYYGDPRIGCCQTRHGWVWDANYRYVYHFDDPSGSPVTSAPTDSTKSGVGSRINPSSDAALQITWGDMGSPINGGAWDLTTPPTLPPAAFGLTTDTFLRVTDGTLAVNQPYTIEAWFRMDVVNANYVGIVTKGRDGGFNDWVGLWVTDTTTAPIHAMALGNLTGGDVVGTTTLVAGQWYYGAVSSTPGNPATRRVFVYDTLQTTDAATNATLTPAVTPPTRVGDDSNGNWLNGRIDEVRFSNIARAPGWLRTTARNEGCPSSTAPWGCGFGIPIATPFLAAGAQQAVAPNNFTSSDCCRVTTSVAGSKTTVATSDSQMVWDTAFGAGLSEVYTEEEANATVNRRGDGGAYNVFTMQVNDNTPVANTWHFERSAAGSLQVVEASPARVRLRQLYDFTASLHLDRTWTVGSYPRMAIDETFVLDSTQDIRGAQGLHPKGETTCADQTFGNTFFCAGNADGTNRFWLVTDNQNTYGDMLAVLYNNTFFARAGAGGVYEQLFEGAGAPNTYFSRVHESTQLSTLVGAYRNLYYFYPRLAGLTSSGTEWQPYANEYRNPDNISPVTLGSGWQDANELTGAGDFYNEAEGAYAFDMNPASGLSFDLDGGTFARLRPFFKIRQWRSLAPNALITLEATNLQYGTHYTSAVKPLSRAYSCPTAACATSTSRANGGLTGANEFLADASGGQNFTLDFSGTNYQYFGSDSKFHGLNVLLATRGAGTGLDLFWEYWNGAVWQSLEAVAGFTDQTANFTAPGTVFWTADPGTWTKRTLVAGDSLPLYWVRVSRLAGSYTTNPVEALIKTDILLFQYCADVTTDFQTFSFFPPVPTAVRLLSFGAEPADGAVELSWRTASELDNLGFHLYRGLSESGPWTRLTAVLIPGLGSSPVGAAYSWHDAGLRNGTRYYYRLEDVDAASRSTSHGPVSAVPQGAPAPTAGGDGGSGWERNRTPSSCPAWVLAQLGAGASPVSCETRGDPFASSVRVVSRSARGATVELLTGGFVVVREARGSLRVLVPGFELPADPAAPALPLRRVLVDAAVGQGVRLDSALSLDLVSYPGLRPSATGASEMAVSRDGTVRAGRRDVALRTSGRGRLAESAARLAGVVFQGEDKRVVVEIQPFRLDTGGGRLVLARRVVVRLSFAGREKAETGRGSHGRRRPPRAAAREVLAELFTSQRGLHSVAFEEALPQQRRPIAAAELRLERQGQAVPLHLEPAGADFGPGGRLFFYADRKAASTAFSAETAYQLVRAADGRRMATRPAAPAGATAAAPASARVELERNRYYQPGLLEAEDLWQWEALSSGASRTVGFALAGVDAGAGAPAALSVFFQGASDAPEVLDHHLRVSLNGVFVGETTFDGRRPYRFESPISAATLRDGPNELTLENAGDTGVSSLVFLDRFALSFPRSATLQQGTFEGNFAETGTARVAGSAGPAYVLDLNPGDGSPTWLTGFETLPDALRFEAQAGHPYLVVSGLGLGTPRVARPALPTLRDATNQADYLIVTPRAFLAAAEPLVERRRSQGLNAQAVAFEEIASVFGGGEPSAEAIRAFLSFAFHSWAPPSPRYVLLLGDASYDPRNFMGSSHPPPLPALWMKTSYLWTVSDPALAAVNGDDPLADMAIGRLPAATVEEAASLVRKQLDWEDSGQDLRGPAALVADNPDAGGDFEADVAEIEAAFLQERKVARLLVRERGAATRDAIREAFDGGLSLASYVGHGGAAVWASENVLNSWDAPSLVAQPRQPVLLTLNCLNGYFVAPAFDSLAEAFVKVEGRGAIAAVSPSGLSVDAPAHAFHRALMTELTSGAHERLGDAVVAAQKAYAGTGAMPELVSVYQLLGDPALRIR